MTARTRLECTRFADDLAGYMTLEEKLGQLDLVHPGDDPALEQAIAAGQVGGVVGGAHALRLQGLATERSRLGIPLFLAAPAAPHGLSPWAAAAAWDAALAEALGRQAARQIIEDGCNALLAPRLAVARDAGAGNWDFAACEPHLLAALAESFVRGARQDGSEASAAALGIVSGSPGDQARRRQTMLRLAQGGEVDAVDCDGVPGDAALRGGFHGTLFAECARLTAIVQAQFATTSSRSLTEACQRGIAAGLIAQDQIDAAARGVLAAKHRIGLFRDPLRRVPVARPPGPYDGASERVRATMVLLRNEAGLLPLSPVSDRVLVVGALDAAGGACADALGRAGIEHSCAPGLALRRPAESWADPAAGDHFAIALTRDAARRADFALVVLEDRHFAPAGPGAWRRPGEATMRMLQGLAQVGTRLVALLATSEPVDLGDGDQHFAAVLQCWNPGEGFEEALGEILTGRFGPQGRLPVTAGRFAFGQGMSYGQSVFSAYRLEAAGGHIAASVTVRNAGGFEARETVQIYVRDSDGAARLAAFAQVDLSPGAETRVSFELGLDSLAAFGPSGRPELAAGPIEILVGKDMRRVLSATVEITPALLRAIVNRDRGYLRLAG